MKSSLKSGKTKINQENIKNENFIDLKEEYEENYSTSKNLEDNDISLENPEIKRHQRCVPLEIYTKVYKDKQTLLSQVELLKDKNELMKSLDNKCKNLEREKSNIENILLNQENYVDKLKKKDR